MFNNTNNNNFPSSNANNLKHAHIEDIDPTSEEAIYEILNISKIKEGFYIGDKISAISLDAITQFKITDIINCTGKQIINQWESIGINYLTLNWNEVPNQILFDSKDEIVDKIMSFIEKSLNEGEGLLVHSFKGKNRACLIPLIYLMKKYKWSLIKSMQYLKSKKSDVEIMPNFYAQLEKYQQRLIQRGELSRDIPWEFENLIDDEEKLMRNTYMNGLPPDKLIDKNNKKLVLDLFNGKKIKNDLKNNNKHINWSDKDLTKPTPIEIFNISKDLILKKDINPINCHLTMLPKKSCIKTKENKNLLDNNLVNNNIMPNNFTNSSVNKSKPKNNKITPNRPTSIKKDKKVIYNKPKQSQNVEILTQKKPTNSSTNTNQNTPLIVKDSTPIYETKNNNYLKNEKKNNLTNENNNNIPSEKNKLVFNIASLNSLNPANLRNYGVIEESTDIIKNNNNCINNKQINNNNNSNNNKTNVINNKPLNNFNPNLMAKKINKPNTINNNNLHPLYYKNKNNGPIKIKNNNSNSKLKKPNTPDINNYNVNLSNSMKGNSICGNLTSSLNNLGNSINGYGSKNNLVNNKKAMTRPSTAPHKEKEKNNKKNEKNTKKIQRPNSVGGKNQKNIKRVPNEKNNGYAINNVGNYFCYSNNNYLNSSNKGNNIWKNNSTSSNYTRGSYNGIKNISIKNK